MTMRRREILLSLMAAAAVMTLAGPAGAQGLDKFPFRLNWTLYGEHAPFFESTVSMKPGH